MDITTVIINFQTPDLLNKAVRSFKEFYPNVNLLIIDNGSQDDGESVNLINRLSEEYKFIESVFLNSNIFHGPAMDMAIKKYVDTKYVFFLDSDTETQRSGFLEKMTSLITSETSIYGVGEIIKANKRGYKSEKGKEILLTPYMLIDTRLYKTLRPFLHHGQPTLHNFADANEKGYNLKFFKISDYINHIWRGTAERFGYGLGLKGKLDYLLNKLGL
ncbi:MAG: glycosyltransferase [Balneola sp.]|nr:glycosyltransferase [Balneola sp.]MBO6651679.1 glycosyltransferase [Balneola sp.]MBO6712883.1 glycosyltransferase [Balneola sp.]MBO6801182.1 glycosyltransferase [Balneola sp.]MBO6871374.1 glycosyltransferase [Balneola sp.]